MHYFAHIHIMHVETPNSEAVEKSSKTFPAQTDILNTEIQICNISEQLFNVSFLWFQNRKWRFVLQT